MFISGKGMPLFICHKEAWETTEEQEGIMALTRKFLSAMGIEQDKVDEIINAHVEVTDALKEERDMYKADADSLAEVKKELADAKAALEKGGKDAYKVKYEALKEDFDDYKKKVSEKEAHSKKEAAYRDMLVAVGVSEKRIASVLKVSDVDAIEFDDDGNVKDADGIKKGIKEEWADFIVSTTQQGAKTATPPAGNGKAYKDASEIMAIKDPTERQQAIADNHELFGF